MLTFGNTPVPWTVGWDLRAQREIAPGDVVIFARGPADQEPQARSFPDIIERDV